VTCHHVRLGNGAHAIVCTRGQRRRRCSTPNCRNDATMECDAPIAKKQRREPRVGDVRVHNEHRVVFEIVGLADPGYVNVQLGYNAPVQRVSVADWLSKTSLTCSRPTCVRCSVRDGRLDLCGVHGRMRKAGAA